MGVHGGGWRWFIRDDEERERPAITRDLLLRVWTFAQPYRLRIVGLLLAILLTSGLSLVSPLLYRSLIDDAIPAGDSTLLNALALGMIAVPILNGAIGVWRRQLNAQIGEGVICDLRRALYAHLQLPA